MRLRVLDALQEPREPRTRIAALEASGVEQFANIDAIESHEQELFD